MKGQSSPNKLCWHSLLPPQGLIIDSCARQGVRELLGAIPYGENDVYLHTDAALMPRRRATWASWNFLGSSRPSAAAAAVCVSYWLNNLQALPDQAPDTFVTLNPPRPPAPLNTLRHLRLAHPVFSFASYAAQQALPSIQASALALHSPLLCCLPGSTVLPSQRVLCITS